MFERKSMINQADIRQLEIIDEVCIRLTDELKNLYPNVAWKQIIVLRKLLIHQYFGVDLKIIWEVINNDLPIFSQNINNILSDINNRLEYPLIKIW
jgi:uncharacterized protein with HEPN domain